MNISNIKVGQEFKNYIALCECLGEKIKGGKGKMYQLQEWKRNFDYVRNKQSFIITEIYNNPIQKEDIISNHQIYAKNIELIMQFHFSQIDETVEEFTNVELLKILGMVNNRYRTFTNEQIKEINSSLSDWEINHFNSRSYVKLKRIIRQSLKSLERRRLINFKYVFYINKNVRNGDKVYKTIEIATETEENNIRKIEKEVLKLMDCKDMNVVFAKFKEKEFYSKVNDILLQRYDINYAFLKIRILFTKQEMLEGLKETENELRMQMNQEQKYDLNNKIFDVMNRQAENYFTKNRKEVNEKMEKLKNESWGEPDPSEVKKIFRYPDVYTYAQKKIAELTILID